MRLTGSTAVLIIRIIVLVHLSFLSSCRYLPTIYAASMSKGSQVYCVFLINNRSRFSSLTCYAYLPRRLSGFHFHLPTSQLKDYATNRSKGSKIFCGSVFLANNHTRFSVCACSVVYDLMFIATYRKVSPRHSQLADVTETRFTVDACISTSALLGFQL